MTDLAAGYQMAFEANEDGINLVIERTLFALRNQLTFDRRVLRRGYLRARLTSIEVTDLRDPPPKGQARADLQIRAEASWSLFGLFPKTTSVLLEINAVELVVKKTQAGLPVGLVFSVTPGLSVDVSFVMNRPVRNWILNRLIAPIIELGVWLGFRIVQEVDIPLWKLLDTFAAAGLRFSANSPFVTGQNQTTPSSALVACDFDLVNQSIGQPAQLQSFQSPPHNFSAVVRDELVNAMVQSAFAKGWLPSRFRVGKWKIYLNAIDVQFVPDRIEARGQLKAKRGKCWCRVKAKIQFSAAVEPKIDTSTGTTLATFQYDANINTQVSTPGMLVVLGVIMFGPLFLALISASSVLINLVLDRFLPFQTGWNQNGNQLTLTANPLSGASVSAFQLDFPLQLSGSGTFDLSRFEQFSLQNGAQFDVGFTPGSLLIKDDELKLEAELK
ncbi:MAG: hypothetical protein CMI00_05985 [Oceanospirillaceae bacterium]|nr:hypothetical protein [Oceanospirillaceae bacterium]|tara:strand:- start:34180 stop:35508 length:1329 start_codon:yes stop_codon:yes gene_type:complete